MSWRWWSLWKRHFYICNRTLLLNMSYLLTHLTTLRGEKNINKKSEVCECGLKGIIQHFGNLFLMFLPRDTQEDRYHSHVLQKIWNILTDLQCDFTWKLHSHDLKTPQTGPEKKDATVWLLIYLNLRSLCREHFSLWKTECHMAVKLTQKKKSAVSIQVVAGTKYSACQCVKLQNPPSCTKKSP